MDPDRERRIRERARAIWEREGRPEGRHEEHWRLASDEIEHDESGSVMPSMVPEPISSASLASGSAGLAGGSDPTSAAPDEAVGEVQRNGHG